MYSNWPCPVSLLLSLCHQEQALGAVNACLPFPPPSLASCAALLLSQLLGVCGAGPVPRAGLELGLGLAQGSGCSTAVPMHVIPALRAGLRRWGAFICKPSVQMFSLWFAVHWCHLVGGELN